MTMLETLLEMGFSKLISEKAVSICGDNLDQAMEWLLAHQDDLSLNMNEADIEMKDESNDTDKSESIDNDTPAESKESTSKIEESGKEEEAGAKSLKCDECGKLFKNSDEVEFHAIKSGHASFSESTEEKKPMTEEEKQEKLKELEDRMKKRRNEKVESNRMEELDKEKKRIQSGKDMAEAKRKFEETEMKLIAQQRRREKLDDKLARQKVKDQIERDRLARKRQAAGAGESASEFSNKNMYDSAQTKSAPLPSQASSTGVKKDYSETRLQIRVPSGPPLVQSFKVNESLAAVKLWVNLNRSEGTTGAPFNLSTTFPRRIFTEEDEEKPLSALDLVPSAVLVMTTVNQS